MIIIIIEYNFIHPELNEIEHNINNIIKDYIKKVI